MVLSPFMLRPPRKNNDSSVAFHLLDGCIRIGCTHVSAAMGECSILNHAQIIRALRDNNGCNNGEIVENGKTQPVMFDGRTLRYRK